MLIVGNPFEFAFIHATASWGGIMTSSLRIPLLIVLTILCSASVVAASTILVRQDGSGDVATIGDALALASDGDVILVGPGTYDGMLLVGVDVELYSEAGAASTILDGADSSAIMQVEAASVVIDGFTFTRAFVSDPGHGAALLVWQGSQAVVTDCVFVDNHAGWDNGAIHARHFGTVVTVSDCEFTGNTATHNGGACGSHTGAVMTIVTSMFTNNSTPMIAGACNAYGATLNVHDSVFVGNSGAVGAIIIEDSSADISGNTFHANGSSQHASVLFNTGSSGSFERNIVANDLGGHGLRIASSWSFTHGCNIFDGNALGAIEGGDLDDSDIIAPALFCDVDGGDLTVCADSPAIAPGNGCGQIGAFGQGCGPCGTVPTRVHSWSTIKDLFN